MPCSQAARYIAARRGFIELLPPIIGPVTDPGIRGSKQVDVDYYGHRYKLMTSAILYKQASLLAFDKIFYIAPNVRLEPLETAITGRHLAEFHQIDVEVGRRQPRGDHGRRRGPVRHVVRTVLRECRAELAALGRDPEAFRALLTRAVRADHPRRRGRRPAAACGTPQNPDAEIDWEGEALISAQDRPAVLHRRLPEGLPRLLRPGEPERPRAAAQLRPDRPRGLRRAGQRQRARARLPPPHRPDAGDRREPRQVRLVPGPGPRRHPGQRRLRHRPGAAHPLHRRARRRSGRPAPTRSCPGCASP